MHSTQYMNAFCSLPLQTWAEGAFHRTHRQAWCHCPAFEWSCRTCPWGGCQAEGLITGFFIIITLCKSVNQGFRNLWLFDGCIGLADKSLIKINKNVIKYKTLLCILIYISPDTPIHGCGWLKPITAVLRYDTKFLLDNA